MIKKIITEISEEDFRKLDLKVYRHERVIVSENIPGHPVTKFVMKEVSLNDILDSEIKYCLESGYESNLRDLDIPVTIAIHEPYTEDDYRKVRETFKGLSDDDCRDYCLRGASYLDKFMNRFTGAQTYQLGLGIAHLYSTRDYFEAHEDYWRVSKKETKVIYRVKLADHWKDEFVLKHKTETVDWPYDVLPDGVSPEYKKALLCICYDLQEDGSWKESYRYGRFIYEYSEHHIPVDKDGVKLNVNSVK